MDTVRGCYEHLLEVSLWVQLPRSHDETIWPLHHHTVQHDLWTGFAFHVPRSDAGIAQHCKLVCLTWWNLHQDVWCKEASAWATKVFHGQACHVRGCIPHLHRVIIRTTQKEEGTMAHSSFADWVVRNPYFKGCRYWGWGHEEVLIQHQEFQSVWPSLHMQREQCKGVQPMDPRGISLTRGRSLEVFLQLL